MSCQVYFSGHQSSKCMKKHISIFPLCLLVQQLFLWKCVIPDFPAVPVWKGHWGLKPYIHPGFEKLFCYFLQEVELLMPGCRSSAYSDKGLLCRVSCSSSTQVPHFCWSCLAPRPARHHSWQLPCPTLPWFINDTSKNALCSYSCLIPPPQTSKAAQESSHWHPLCSYFSSTPCLPLQHKAETEKRKKCLPRYCYACFVVLVSMYLLDHRPEQQGAIQMNCCHLYMSCHLAAH